MAKTRVEGGGSRPANATPWGRLGLAIQNAPGLAALVGIALAGLAISIYLTTVHYQGVPLLCPRGGLVDCAAVTSSSYSVVPGTALPITIPGMLWFVVSGGLALVAWRAAALGQREAAALRPLHALWGGLGLAFVLYLVYAEIVRLHHLCEWCTVVHLLTLATFLLALSRLQSSGTAMGTPARGRRAVAAPPSFTHTPQRPSTRGATRPAGTGRTQMALPRRRRR